MSDSDRSFSDNLDLLIKLLRKLKDKASLEDSGVPKMFFTNFDFVLNNYETMKGQITQQLLNQFGESIKQMVSDMVEQLKEELGEEELIEFEEEMRQAKKPAAKIPSSEEFPDVIKAIEEIDRQLKSGEVPEGEIDQLLDERSRLKKKLEKDKE